MEAPGLSTSLLLLLLLSTSSSALSQQCSHADLEILDTGAKDLQPVFTIDNNGSNYINQHSFLQPEPGFLGFKLEVEGTTTVFFPAQDHCFPGNDTRWWRVMVEYKYSRLLEDMTCRVLVGECCWRCVKNHTSQHDLPSFRVMARGPSRWRSTPPPDKCAVQDWQLSPPYKDRTCRDLSLPSTLQRHTDTTNTGNTTIDTTTNTTNIDTTNTTTNTDTTTNTTNIDTTTNTTNIDTTNTTTNIDTTNTTTNIDTTNNTTNIDTTNTTTNIDTTNTTNIDTTNNTTTNIDTTTTTTTTNTTNIDTTTNNNNTNIDTTTTTYHHNQLSRLGVVSVMVTVPLVVVLMVVVREKCHRSVAAPSAPDAV